MDMDPIALNLWYWYHRPREGLVSGGGSRRRDWIGKKMDFDLSL